MQVKEGESAYSGTLSVTLGSNPGKPLSTSNRYELSLTHMSTGGGSIQSLATGEFISGYPSDINGPGTFPQRWELKRSSLTFVTTLPLGEISDAGGTLFVSLEGGLNRYDTRIKIHDPVNSILLEQSDRNTAPLIGVGLGYQFNDIFSLHLDGSYSLYLFDEQHSSQIRFYGSLLLAGRFFIQAGYQQVFFDNSWDMEMEIDGPWVNLGLKLR